MSPASRVVLALGVAACGTPPLADVPAAPAPSAARPAGRAAARVLYRGPTLQSTRAEDGARAPAKVSTSFLGVDQARKVAFVARHRGERDPYLEIVELDLAEHGPWAAPRRWTPSLPSADAEDGPPAGALPAELKRYAALVERTGPFFTRSRAGMPGPTLSVSASHLAVEHGRDRLWLFDRATGANRRLATDLDEAQAPAFSPDGRALAYRGCKTGAPRPGRYASCPPQLFVQELAAAVAAKRVGVDDPGHPLWSPDGRWIYVAEHDRGHVQQPGDRGGCLVRVRAAPPFEPTQLRCDPQQEDLDVSLDPLGETAVMIGGLSTPGRSRLVWLELPSGTVKRTIELERPKWRASLGPRGLVVVGSEVFGDLSTGKVRRVEWRAQPRERSLFPQVSEVWTDAGEVFVYREALDGSEEEILLVDVAAVVASKASTLDELVMR